MTDAQARRLCERAASARRIVEIGSYRGRSAIVLARAAPDGVAVVAIDPHAGNDRGPQQIEGSAGRGRGRPRAFSANLAARRRRRTASGTCGCPRRKRSARSRASSTCSTWTAPTATARPATTSRDWGARVRPGGTLLVHDCVLVRRRDAGHRPRCCCSASASATLGRTRLAGRVPARAPATGAARVRNAVRQLARAAVVRAQPVRSRWRDRAAGPGRWRGCSATGSRPDWPY